MESYPYEPEERGSDYVRLASIAAGDWRAATATSVFSASTQHEASYSATHKYTLVPTKLYMSKREKIEMLFCIILTEYTGGCAVRFLKSV